MLLAVLGVCLHIIGQELTSHVGRIKQHVTTYRPTPQNRVVDVTGSLRNTVPPPSLSDNTRCSKSIRSDNTVGRGHALETRCRKKKKRNCFEAATNFSEQGPHSAVLGVHLANKFPSIYGIQGCVTVFTASRS
jgi:hypothetical protein